MQCNSSYHLCVSIYTYIYIYTCFFKIHTYHCHMDSIRWDRTMCLSFWHRLVAVRHGLWPVGPRVSRPLQPCLERCFQCGPPSIAMLVYQRVYYGVTLPNSCQYFFRKGTPVIDALIPYIVPLSLLCFLDIFSSHIQYVHLHYIAATCWNVETTNKAGAPATKLLHCCKFH